MTPQASDTPALRKAFCNEFMWMSDLDFQTLTMPKIMEMFDDELGKAKRLYGYHFNADSAWDEADTWLEERGYYSPETLEG